MLSRLLRMNVTIKEREFCTGDWIERKALFKMVVLLFTLSLCFVKPKKTPDMFNKVKGKF